MLIKFIFCFIFHVHHQLFIFSNRFQLNYRSFAENGLNFETTQMHEHFEFHEHLLCQQRSKYSWCSIVCSEWHLYIFHEKKLKLKRKTELSYNDYRVGIIFIFRILFGESKQPFERALYQRNYDKILFAPFPANCLVSLCLLIRVIINFVFCSPRRNKSK